MGQTKSKSISISTSHGQSTELALPQSQKFMYVIACGDSPEDIKIDTEGFLLPQTEDFGFVAAAWEACQLVQPWRDAHAENEYIKPQKLFSIIAKAPVKGVRKRNSRLYLMTLQIQKDSWSSTSWFEWFDPDEYRVRKNNLTDNEFIGIEVGSEQLGVYDWEWGC